MVIYDDIIQVNDGEMLMDIQAIKVTVADGNEAPTLAAAAVESVDDGPTVDIDLSLLGDDIDSDDDGATLTYMIAGAPSEGTATISGTTLTFVPGAVWTCTGFVPVF